jgi:hypothetical protein
MSLVRKLAAVAALMVGGLVGLGATTAASAAPYTNQVSCAISSTSPTAGGSLSVSGTGFHKNSTVTITLHTAVTRLGSARTDSAGAFAVTVQLPEGVSGAHTVVVQGSAAVTDTCSAALTVGSGTGGVAVGPQGGGGTGGTGGVATGATGGTAYTGVAALGLSGLGALLLVGGGVLLLVGRRRRVEA